MEKDAEEAFGPRARGFALPIAHLEGASELPRAMFAREVLERSHLVVASARIEREGEPLALEDVEGFGELMQASIDRRGVRSAFLRSDQGSSLLLARDHRGAFEVSVAAADGAVAKRLSEAIAGGIGVEGTEDARVAVAFWSGSGDALFPSPEARWRRLSLPHFAEIEDNYPVGARRHLGDLLSQPSGDALPGRLALWHGPPGTGKTWALRALGREWSSWCDLHYVTDPERLLGGDTGYMLGVLAGNSEPPNPDFDDELEPDRHEPGERWRLLVLEDAGELLGIKAPTEFGRGFARLLNITDGLLGQGTRALVLVTTNEPLGKLHPGALRPGRAMATVEFSPLAASEATAWLRRRGLERELRSPATIADLHALLAGGLSSASAPTRVGFG